ncbi:MAG: YciK family oxidoreductase [Candidatus Competibacterales bacterium]
MVQISPNPESRALEDRVVLITGACSGIGTAAAHCFARAGATVVLLDRRTKPLEALYDAIEARGGPTPALYPLDLLGASPADYRELSNQLLAHFGRLDGLLHNAADIKGLTPLANFVVEQWYQSLQVNLNGPFLLTQALLEPLKRSADASVVFTTDAVGAEGRAYWGAYAVAKGAIDSLVRLLAHEWQANTPIRVNAIDPGAVRTATRMRLFPGVAPTTWPEPEAVMAAYLYLMGPASRGMTGQTLRAQAFGAPGEGPGDDGAKGRGTGA